MRRALAASLVVLGVLAWAPAHAKMDGVEAVIKAEQKREPEKKKAPEKPKAEEKPKKKDVPTKASEGGSASGASDKSAAKQMGGDGGRAVSPTIIIDPGHGGKDPGAIGRFGGKKRWRVREKDVVLQISRHLATALRKRLKAKVSFTRSKDVFITLGGRNRIANRRQCDLFLSVHANAAKNSKAAGLEIYSLNKATDEASRRLAARENAGAPAEEKDIEAILSDLLQTAVAEESVFLARDVEKSFRKRLQKKYGIERLERKTALFYVLVGAKCPSLLIETGFVTNAKEGRRLKQASYQKQLANAIAEGVAAFWEKSDGEGEDL